jgi:hypothetical protein
VKLKEDTKYLKFATFSDHVTNPGSFKYKAAFTVRPRLVFVSVESKTWTVVRMESRILIRFSER